ncbi:MAG: hypothetical protein LBG19_01925 [Prevotellaceae bacterium]|jgi:hypothetical protein|nr:hypothetical protein [Prevotellaceae bacterium]
MKSSNEQLQKRGFADDEFEKGFKTASYHELLIWLNDPIPVKRTVAARRLGRLQNINSVEPLCIALEKEKALYCKLEICNTLILFGKDAVPHLIGRLGKVANKQYKAPPKKKFGKKSYPLPHDIFARTLMKMSGGVLPELCAVLDSDNTVQMSEAIDAVGYICFYDTQKRPDVAQLLYRCYQKYIDNNLLKWKLIRAMSAFYEMLPFLENQYQQLKNGELRQEAERSISIIKSKL